VLLFYVILFGLVSVAKTLYTPENKAFFIPFSTIVHNI